MDASGYYYFGARYYEPQTQMWLSPDPILGSYMKGGPNGGVLNARNLGLYTYAWNSPVAIKDSNGLCPYCSLTPEVAKLAFEESQRNPMTLGQLIAIDAGFLVGGFAFTLVRALAVGAGVGAATATVGSLAVSGAAGGVTTQAVNDIANGQMSSAEQYADAAGSGAFTSMAVGGLLYTPGEVMSPAPPPGEATVARVAELRAAVPAGSRGRITMGVGVAEDASGARRVLVGTSEPRGYLRPGVTLAPGETIAPGSGHAEADIVNHAQKNGMRLLEVGATRPICSRCASAIAGAGAKPVTPLKE
jgi:RHS repeat-associated protein